MVNTQEILDALDGTAYLSDRDGTITSVGQQGWLEFANDTDALIRDSKMVVGKKLFDMIRGESVKNSYRQLHESAWLRRRKRITFDYRCDSPAVRREMRMSISSIHRNDVTIALLYQSQIVSETARVPMMFFSEQKWLQEGSSYDKSKILKLCSYCHDVNWPIGADIENQVWISPEEYYQRLGPTDVMISHGVCPTCFDKIVTENTTTAEI